jgi:hypothetical protein
MVCLFYFGRLVERIVGPTLFVACYFMSAITGSCASLFIHPTHVSVGASGAVIGTSGMLLSMTVRAWRLSARQVVGETVAAFDANIAVSGTITTLNISTPGDATELVASTRTTESTVQPEGTPTLNDAMLRKIYASVASFVMYNRAICTDILHFPARVLVTDEAGAAIGQRT